MLGALDFYWILGHVGLDFLVGARGDVLGNLGQPQY